MNTEAASGMSASSPGSGRLMLIDNKESAAESVDSLSGISSLRAPCASLLNILVVEDDAQSRQLVCDMLSILGHQATGVATAEDAIQALLEQRFEVLLADIDLPGMSGLELASQAMRRAPTLKVIFASGYVTSTGPGEQPNTMLLPKPFDLLELKEALAELG